jgi:long-subunit acyl-CoA synthetase (AMP-forming)
MVNGVNVTRRWRQRQHRNAVNPEGWLHTGNLAIMGSNGCFRIMSRVKDMISSPSLWHHSGVAENRDFS